MRRFEQPYALSSVTTSTIQGTKRPDGACEFSPQSMRLPPGRYAAEVRESAIDPATCAATIERGTPPATELAGAQPPGEPSQAGQSESAGAATGSPSVSMSRRRSRSRRRAMASASKSQGYVTTYWEDPVGIDVNKVNDGISYLYNGSCVTYGYYEKWHLYWYSPSGWGKNADNFRSARQCSLEAASSYALFENDVFCFPNSCFAEYNRTSIHGHADGTLYGFWKPDCHGDSRCGLLSWHAQLIRQI